MRYRVKVLQGGVVRDLVLNAADMAALEKQVAQERMSLLSARAERMRSLRIRRSAFSTFLFTQELVALLDAGLSIIEAMETLHEKTAEPLARQVLGAIVEDMYQGLALSTAFSRQPEHFPALYAATVASAERTGHIVQALQRYQHYEARQAAIRKKIVAAMIYPAVVVCLGGAILLFLLFYVIPKFSQIYEGMKNLPLSARLMLQWGELVQAHGAPLFALITGMPVALAAMLRDARARAAILALVFAMPALAAFRKLSVLARFYRCLGLLLAGGMPAVQALDMAARLLPDDYRERLLRSLGEVRAGQPLSVALPGHGLGTPVADRLLRVGEKSGELPQMAERIAAFCDSEFDKGVDLFTRLFEPALMAAVGIVIGAIVFLLYMPIFQLAGTLE